MRAPVASSSSRSIISISSVSTTRSSVSVSSISITRSIGSISGMCSISLGGGGGVCLRSGGSARQACVPSYGIDSIGKPVLLHSYSFDKPNIYRHRYTRHIPTSTATCMHVYFLPSVHIHSAYVW